MLSILKNKLNIIVIVLIIILGVAYFFYSNQNPADNSVLGPQKISTSTTPSTNDKFFNTLKTLNHIRLNSAIFDDQAFLGLQDFNTDLPDQPVGRVNPFSPTGRDSSVSATSSSAVVR